MKNSNPIDVARETLRQLTSLKIPPTPDNYHKLYDQISGNPETGAGSLVPESTNQELIKANELIDPVAAWGDTIEALLKQLENKQGELTVAKKKEGVYRVLAKFSKNSNQLYLKLNALIDSWEVLAPTMQEFSKGESVKNTSSQINSNTLDSRASQVVSEHNHLLSTFTDQLLELLSQILEHVVAKQIEDITLNEEVRVLAYQVRKIQNISDMERFVADFKQFYRKFDVYGENGFKLKEGLLKLLKMLMNSTGELLAEDQWVGTRINKLRDTISKPLDLQVIQQAEHYLEEITQRQEIIRRNLNEAKMTLKLMVASLITNIEELSDTTGEYQIRLEQYSERINKTDDIKELNQLLGLIMEETKQMQKNALTYRDDFLVSRAEASLAQSKIDQLETELIEMGEKVHEDHLTGILNRRGLDAAFTREVSRSMRHQSPLSYALLDIDNFKQLNDTHGHKVGDDALKYLVESVKDTTRPEDIVSRYGGEEFVILLPNTNLEEAVQILSRIRRNLTKKFFLHENKRLLITFSAGVAQLRSGESQESIFKRADEALYRAKKGGKNQILEAEQVI
ncbi:GGDEF domain-containing protein [Nitrosomonas supralitoralis]|uniref:diguanylate cyclase n=1 Tax=Nitrosomonas supralitoralis TaxID=2116706 RepID=A0A2P7NY50_9PROT|nr:GGDEF domain-containing protein [Nitrosomonas supralitoralis]PSJ18395.1 GGDEF domain-containing protein [Nitrosomonas supralitoralis]